MRKRAWPILPGIIVCVGALTAAVSPAFAECGGNNVPLNLCKRCTTTSTKYTHRNQECTFGFTSGANYVFVAQRIVSPPAHGQAQVTGSSFVYRPAKDFVGTDVFKMEVNLLNPSDSEKKLLVLFREITMIVQP